MEFITMIFEMIKEAISENLLEILIAIGGVVFTFLGTSSKKILKQWADTKEKRAVVKTVVMQTEQVWKKLHGSDKLHKAMETASEILNEKGIPITELELIVLIEAAVGEFNDAFNKASWEDGLEKATSAEGESDSKDIEEESPILNEDTAETVG